MNVLIVDVKHQKENKMKTYKIFLKCNNCNRNMIYNIPKGTKILTFIKNTECKYCGCKGYLE